LRTETRPPKSLTKTSGKIEKGGGESRETQISSIRKGETFDPAET